MSDLDDVVRLLERWRDATGIGRLRIGMDASRVIAALPVDRKRALAVEVAGRVAPQLVPAIRADDGDLTAEQVGALVDLLRRADQDQLDDLVTALRTGEVGTAIDIVDEAVAVVAPPPEPEPAVDEPATPPAAGPPADAPDPTTAAADEEPVLPVAAATTPAVAAAEGDDSAAVPSALADDEVEIGEDGSVALDEAAVRARLEREAAARADRYRDTSRDVPTTPSYRAPAMDFTTDLELPDPTPLRRSTDSPSSSRDAARLTAPPVTAVVAAITATPDGYRRRRAALAAIREGRLERGDLPAVARSFARGTDRAWVVGAALDAGVIGADGLTGMGLSPPAEDRLRRRAS